MHLNTIQLLTTITTIIPLIHTTTAQSFISASPLSPAVIARSLTSKYPNPSFAMLADYWWWESGTVIDALLTYGHTTNDRQYNALLSNTLISQVTASNDFMTPDATGNDDQAWWALAAMSAAEFGLPSPGQPWINYARNVFYTQKGRWDPVVPGKGRVCGGGLRWKIYEDATYRSTISNALFFQLASRVARYTGDREAREWAEKAYAWIGDRGLIDPAFNVYDGTSDGDSCSSVNHDQWSYNVGAVMYGAAVMWDVTKDTIWRDRAIGFVNSARRNFVRDGALFETKCESSGTCNKDQVAFKGILARWMGATAVLVGEVRGQVLDTMNGAAGRVAQGWTGDAGPIDQFKALEIIDAQIAAGGGVGAPGRGVGSVKRRSIAGRVWF